MKIIKLLLIILIVQSCSSAKIKSLINLGFSSKNENSIKNIQAGNKIYTIDQKGRVWAIDLEKEKKIWRIKLKEHGKYTDIDYIDEKIIVSNGINEIFLIDANSGKILKSKEFFSTPISIKFLQDETIVVNSLNNKTYFLLDMDSIIWTHESYNKEISTLGSSDILEFEDNLIISYSSGEVYFLNRYNGSVIWSSDLVSSKFSGIFTYLSDIDINTKSKDNHLYVTSNNGIVKSLLLSNGQEAWNLSLDIKPLDFVIFENKLAIISKNKLFIVNAINGNIEKQIDTKTIDSKQFKNLKNISYNKGYLVVNNKDKIFILNSTGALLKKIRATNEIVNKPVFYDNIMYYSDSGWFFNNLKYINFNGRTF